MAKIIGVTVGTPISPSKLENKLKPVKTVNGVAPDENGNVNVVGNDGKTPYIQNGYWYIDGVNTNVKARAVDGYTPVKGTDYWTNADKEEITAEANALIADELAKRMQLTHEFANSIEELEESGDTSKVYVLPDGYIYAYMTTTKLVEKYENAAKPDSDEWLVGTRIGNSGLTTDSSAANHTTTNPIYCITGDTLYVEGVTINENNNYIVFMNDSPKVYQRSSLYAMVNGTDTTGYFSYSKVGDTYVFKILSTAAGTYVRFCFLTENIQENIIISVNNPILPPEEKETQEWGSTGIKFIDVDFENPTIQDIIREETRNNLSSIQLTPEFAESEEWLKTEGNADKTKLYVTPDNFIWACMPKEVGGYKNLLPEAVGDDHTTPYNGKGYKDGARLASGGYESTLSDAFLTGFVPVKVGETLYLNGNYIKTDWASAAAANARFYTKDFEDIAGVSMPMGSYGIVGQHFSDVVTNDGYVTQFTLNPNWTHYSKWSDLGYIRMTLIGTGAGCIIANTPIVKGDIDYVWANTNHSFVPNEYDEEFVALNDSINEAKADIVKLNEATDESIAELNKRIEDVEEGSTSVPEHWKSAIATAKATVNEKQALGGVNCASFVWTSDIHASASFDERGKRLGIVAKAIMDECDIPLFISTGDLMSQSSHPDTSGVYNELALVRKWLSPIPYYQQALIMGNHDGAWGGTSDETYYKWQLPLNTMYNLIYRKQAMDMRRVSGDNGTYYYIDNESQKVRYIMLNSNNTSSDATNGDGTAVQDRFRKSCLGQTQLYWLSDVALDMPDGYTACIFLHEPYVGSEIDKNDDSYPGEYPQLVGIVDAYNNRGSYSGTFKDSDNTWRESTINKNFANAQGEIAGVFAGHTHVDAIRHTGNNPMYLTCPLIITPNSLGGEVRDGTTRTEGTDTEFAMDIVTIDKANKHIYLTRLGGGADREVSYKREN